MIEAVPPIPFALVDQHSGEQDVAGSDRIWARVFAEMLVSSEASPLSEGIWHLGLHGSKFSEGPLPPEVVRKIVEQRSHGYVQWDFGDLIYPITLQGSVTSG